MAAPKSTSTPATAAEPQPQGHFPRVFWVALLLEFVERLAYYGVYVNLALYLLDSVHFTATENGFLLGWFAAGRAWIPILTGSLSDKLGFRRSLITAFACYIVAYTLLISAPTKPLAVAAIIAMAIAGAFLKPVIPAAVRRYAPEGREQVGFSWFYASVNAGSVVGKVLTKFVRSSFSLRASIGNAVVACALGLGLTLALFREPSAQSPGPAAAAFTTPAEKIAAQTEVHPHLKIGSFTLPRALQILVENPRLLMFLGLVSGYYLLIEQFYQTFPVHIVRLFGEHAPRELITLINPASIALLQVGMGHLTKRIPPLYAMSAGIALGAVSMLCMGAIPSLWGAGGSFFIFALAEMIYSPRYYQYVASFAPKGLEGTVMGLALMPFGIGGLAGGVLSGRLIKEFLPAIGARNPLAIWGTYACIGVVCALALAGFATWARSTAKAPNKSNQRPL